MSDSTSATPRGVRLQDDRDATAAARDQTSESHDHTADERDELARARDERADGRDRTGGRIDVDSASDRNAARRDRESAKGDRVHASKDRQAAVTNRTLSSNERASMLLDELTGCYLRAAGFLELEREIIKAERVEQPFTMVFVDVDGLKRINDTQGHEAGDALLRAVVDSVRQVVREYDVVVRYGGDEFLCGMADCDSSEVSVRFERANAALRRADHASVSFGIVERTKGETLASLISRADQAMYDAREERLAQTRPATRDS